MTRKELETNLGRQMRLRLFNGREVEGILRKTNEEQFKNQPNLYLKPNYYFMTDEAGNCITVLFRVSHVKKVLIRFNSIK